MGKVMMKRMTGVFVFCFTLAFSASALSRTFSGKIIDLISWSDGHSAIKIESGPLNGCSGSTPEYYSLGVKGQDAKAEPMLSMVLAAYLGERPVRIVTTDGNCQGGQEKINQLQVLK
jgi:hypothetical protein